MRSKKEEDRNTEIVAEAEKTKTGNLEARKRKALVFSPPPLLKRWPGGRLTFERAAWRGVSDKQFAKNPVKQQLPQKIRYSTELTRREERGLRQP